MWPSGPLFGVNLPKKGVLLGRMVLFSVNCVKISSFGGQNTLISSKISHYSAQETALFGQ